MRPGHEQGGGEEPAAREARVVSLAQSFTERRRRGERPTIEEYVARHPEIEAEIRDLFPMLCVLEDLGPAAPEQGPAAAGPEIGPLQRLGEYRIIREVGRGGMGVVYEAEQETLKRRVALKVLPFQAFQDEHQLERFRREAQAAARLHHTNIVPVFGVGEDRGVHFYVMQFIRGQTLAEVLQEVRRLRAAEKASAPDATATEDGTAESVARTLIFGREAPSPPEGTAVEDRAAAGTPPVEPPAQRADSSSSIGKDPRGVYYRSVARIALQAAEGLAYAHNEGVLHRDIKPSNLLLDLTGSVWITDFGLAKVQGSGELTISGGLAGTLRYMAPERFRGAGDAKSDVYSLGITLYELLTLRPAFAASDRAEVLRDVALRDPPPPRRLDPGIPRDLETVVLKAIAKNPQDRYSSAAALADDLRRYLHHEPVSARRASAPERLWRWCQRSPLAAGFAAASLLLLLAFAAGATFAAFHLRAERNAALSAEAKAAERLRLMRIAAARLRRQTGSPGQRFENLRDLKAAAEVRSDAEVMTEAIASLGLVDVEVEKELPYSGSEFLAFDPWIRTYATGEPDGSVAVRGVDDGVIQASFPPVSRQNGPVTSLGFSPSGALLGVGFEGPSGREVRVLTVSEGKELLRLPSPGQNHAFAFAPDEKSVAVRTPGGNLEILSLPDGEPLVRLARPPGWVEASKVAFDATGGRLAGVCHWKSFSVYIWDARQGSVEKVLTHGGYPLAVAWHPAANLLAVGCGDFRAYLWDVEFERIVSTYIGHRAEVVDLAFHPEGRILCTGSWDGDSRFWDAESSFWETWAGPALVRVFGRLKSWDRSGRRAGYGAEKRPPGIWSIDVGNEVRRLAFRLRGKGTRNLALSPEGDLIAAACDPDGLQVALASGGNPRRLSDRTTRDAAFLSNGRGLLSAEGRVLLYPIERADGVVRILDPRVVFERGEVLGVSPDDRFVATQGRGGMILLAELDGGQAARPLARVDHVSDLEVSPGGRWVAVRRKPGYGPQILDTATGKTVWSLGGKDGCLYFSPCGRWLLANTSTSTSVFEAGTWKLGWSRPPRDSGLFPGYVAFPEDPRYVFAGGANRYMGLYELATGREVARFENRDGSPVTQVACRGRTLVLGSDSRLVQVSDLAALERGLVKLGLELELAIPAPVPGQAASRIEFATGGAARAPRASRGDRIASLTYLIQTGAASADLFEARAELFAAVESPATAVNAALDLERALRLKPRDPARTSLRRAQVLEPLGSPEEFLKECDRCLSLAPNLVEAVYLRGQALSQLQRPAEAAQAFEQVLGLEPEHARAAEGLAWILLAGPRELRDVKRAFPLARLAAKGAPDSPSALRTLALACYRAGIDEEARKTLAAAFALRGPVRPVSARFILALVKARAGDLAGARLAFEEGASIYRGGSFQPQDVEPVKVLFAEAEAAVR